MMLKRLLRRDNKGIGAVEFALIAPVLISFVIGVAQMGKLFFANADMKNAMAHGARVASVWPVPEPEAVEEAVNDRLVRTGALAKANVEITDDEDENGNHYYDIEMTYQVPLEFIFFDIGPVTLSDTRRVFLQMDGVMPEGGGGSGTTSTGTTSTTSSGDASTSTTSAGGTTSSTSATSASSTGGTTSSTSTTSSTTTSSTSSGKHNHGNCKKKC